MEVTGNPQCSVSFLTGKAPWKKEVKNRTELQSFRIHSCHDLYCEAELHTLITQD